MIKHENGSRLSWEPFSFPHPASPLDVSWSSLAGFALSFFVWGQRPDNWGHPLPIKRKDVIKPLFGTKQLIARIA